MPVTLTRKVHVRGEAEVPAAIEPEFNLTDPLVVLTVPGVQVVAAPPVVVSPVGKLSVTENPEIAAPEMFLTVTTNWLVPPGAIVEGEKTLVMDAPLVTVKVAVPDEWATPPMVPAGTLFTKVPAAGAVTVAVIVQLAGLPAVAALILPPETPSVVLDEVTEPPQVVEVPPATVTPAGIVSVKIIPEMGVALKLVSVNVKVLVPPVKIPAGLKTLVTAAAFCTVTEPAMAAALRMVSVVLTPLIAMLLVNVPLAAEEEELRATILTSIVQLPFAGMVPPLKVSEVAKAAAVTVPPQLLAIAGTLAACICAGKLSVKAAPVNGKLLGLLSVIVIRDTAPAP